MKQNKELSKIRIETELHEKILKLIDKLNENNAGIEITLPTFRKMAYRYLYNKIQTEGLEIKWGTKTH